MTHCNTSSVCISVCVCVSYVVDHQVHDGLGDQVSDGAVDDGQVRVHQVPDDLHLSLQLRVHAVDLPVAARLLHLHLHKHGRPLNTRNCGLDKITETPAGTSEDRTHLLFVLQDRRRQTLMSECVIRV